VNSIDRDGTGAGFDAELLRMVRAAVRIPVVASSGAGTAQHFVDVFADAGVESALAAGIFHREEVSIAEVKAALVNAGISARTDDADVVEVSQ
jgi:glutamine amidotransferase/cyclase